MNRVVLIEKPDLLLHLGDGAYDMYRARSEFPAAQAIGVRGNCDVCSEEPAARTLDFDGVKIHMAHGHLYGVKSGYDTAIDAANREGADILLFGHTHNPVYEMRGDLQILNPGSLFDGQYAVIEIKDGKTFCRLKSI
jgi:putative phosphoesterase